MARRGARATGIVLGLTIAVLAAAGALLTISHSRSAAEQQRYVVSNYETMALMRTALIVLQDAEIGQRAYLLTGEVANLGPYEQARPRVETALRQIEATVNSDQEALRQIGAFKSAANEKLDELNAGIVAYQLYGREATLPQGSGRMVGERIRQTADSFVEGQRLQLSKRLAMVRSEQDQADLAGLLVLGGAFICLVAGMVIIVRSGERLEQVQRELSAHSRLLQATLETLRDPIFVLDAGGSVVAWNEAFVRLAGWDPRREPRLNRHDLLSGRFPAMRSLLAPLKLETEVSDQASTARASCDGREYEVSRGRMAEGGAVIRCVDVTDKLRDEAALRQGQKMEAVGQLTGGMAHDFNNILQIVQANLDLIKEDMVGNEVTLSRLQSASAAAERGARLTQQLLAFSRRQPLAPRPTNVGRLVHDLSGLLRHALGERITLEVAVPAEAWNATIDPGQLENAILNLAINARDAMPEGGTVRVEVSNATLDRRYASLHSEVSPGSYVLIDVIDTGTGMPAEVVARAFDPFFTTKQEGKGTGLGLSMVYGFVRQSNGHIRIDSAIGQGTSVKLYLPRTLDPVVDAASEATSPAGGTARILVVEDNTDVRLAVVDMLSGWGYRVTAAESPDAAAALLERDSSYDLLFTDVVMPGTMSAVQLAALARRLQPEIAVLLTSGFSRDLIPKKDGPDYPMIAKPYRSEELATKVRSVLSSRTGSPAEGATPSNADRSRREAEPPRERPRRVLLVEDEVVLRMSTTDMLERLDCFVTGVGSGEEALDVLDRGGAFDLLLTDLGLPGMNGEELAKRVKARFPSLPVIIASGYASAGPQPPGIRFISKPYSSIDLQQAFENLDHITPSG
ncbi:Signal transduction histidine kinase [Enhydrobacter aerosaccus]|uniref:histidine kinase n=1 Tax=Enhydrobacter aerosaccus TaxID=225324 RepID=A0A1T4T9U1_9HYPH|nr:response regulator [Enhydrobacter aerosaccus]SKA37049.1 Signal transduction histidine kinase [Enhydrobacter aerosaccus]